MSGALVGAIGVAASFWGPTEVLPWSVTRGLRPTVLTRAFMGPVCAFVCLTFTYGGVASVNPLMLKGRGPASAASFFLILGLCRMAGRSGAGRSFGDSPQRVCYLRASYARPQGWDCLYLRWLCVNSRLRR